MYLNQKFKHRYNPYTFPPFISYLLFQQKLISKYEFQLSQLNQDLIAIDRLKSRAESQAESEVTSLLSPDPE